MENKFSNIISKRSDVEVLKILTEYNSDYHPTDAGLPVMVL